MSKSTPPRDPESAYFENLGRMNAAAGIQWLMPRLNSWLGDQLQSMLHGLGLPQDALAKPVRNSASLAATEASLGLLIGEPRVKRVYTKRGTGPVAQGVRYPKLSGMDMVDGRYTKLGAARALGVHPSGLYRHVEGVDVQRTRIPGTQRGSCNTYDAAQIDALATQRVPATPLTATAEHAERASKNMTSYWAGKTKEERRAIMHERFTKRTDAFGEKLRGKMTPHEPVPVVTLEKTTRKGVRK